MQMFGALVGYAPFTCAQARLVGRTPFSHALDKYGVHGLHSAFLIAWMRTKCTEISMILSATLMFFQSIGGGPPLNTDYSCDLVVTKLKLQ